ALAAATCNGGAARRTKAGTRCARPEVVLLDGDFRAHPGMDAALEPHGPALGQMASLSAAARRYDEVGIGRRRQLTRRTAHARRAALRGERELAGSEAGVQHRDDATAEFRDLREGVRLAAAVRQPDGGAAIDTGVIVVEPPFFDPAGLLELGEKVSERRVAVPARGAIADGGIERRRVAIVAQPDIQAVAGDQGRDG